MMMTGVVPSGGQATGAMAIVVIVVFAELAVLSCMNDQMPCRRPCLLGCLRAGSQDAEKALGMKVSAFCDRDPKNPHVRAGAGKDRRGYLGVPRARSAHTPRAARG